MAKFGEWLLKDVDEHLKDELIIASIDGDSPTHLSAAKSRHLERCWQCLARRQELQVTIFSVVDYQRALLAPFLPLPSHGEERFIARLDRQIENSGRRWWTGLALRFRPAGLPQMTPVFASFIVIAIAITTLLGIWSRRGPGISANEFLEHAERWDQSPKSNEPGVVYQRIQIRAPLRILERTVYRDVQRRRQPRKSELNSQEAGLKTTLAVAGVNWEEPLSAGAFKSWHDRQESKQDKVARAGDLMTLTTSVPSGSVSSESLTVRRTDFHPVARKVQFRDAGTIEIAELDYAVLGWAAVNDSLFGVAPTPMVATPPSLSSASLPTREELDEAELQARVVLSRLNADSSEQLEFSRTAKAILVNGVVETEQRKKALLAQLRPLTHVMSSIFSLEELNTRRDLARTPVANIREYSDVARPSPLEQFFRQQGKSQSDVSAASQQLLDAVLAVQQESSALSELLARFSPDLRSHSPAQTALNELLGRHSTNLSNDLDAEERVIRSIYPVQGSVADTQMGQDAERSRTLTVAAARNSGLCNEMITGTQSSSRPAEAIAPEILQSIEEIRRLARGSGSVMMNTGELSRP